MWRLRTESLEQWLVEPQRRPLVMRGARQVGKTWLVRDLAARTKRALFELNLERDPGLATLFEHADPAVVVRNVEAWAGRAVVPAGALLFIDEIQAAPSLLAKLRWFAEELPSLPVIAAGSLLDFALADASYSMPVGRIGYLYVEPLGFEEYLRAVDELPLLERLGELSLDAPLPQLLHQRALSRLREYALIGGMPRAIESWSHRQSWLDVSRVQQDLLTTYRDDFARYAGRVPPARLDRVLSAVPRLLSRKFKYNEVDPDARAAAVRQALDLTIKARLCHPVQATHATGTPLGAEVRERTFKVIMGDVGLASAALGLAPHEAIRDERLVHEGGLAEQLVGQALRASEPFFLDPALYYWTREKASSSAEVDYVIPHGSTVVPVEVKAGATGTMRSLHLFMALRGLNLAVRFDARPPSLVEVDTQTSAGRAAYRLLSLPTYLAGQLGRWLDDLL